MRRYTSSNRATPTECFSLHTPVSLFPANSGNCQSIPNSPLFVKAWCTSSAQHVITTCADPLCSIACIDTTALNSGLDQCASTFNKDFGNNNANCQSSSSSCSYKFSCNATPALYAATIIPSILVFFAGLGVCIFCMRKHNRCFCCGRRCCRHNRAENQYEPMCCNTPCVDCCDGERSNERAQLLAAYEGAAKA